MKSYCITINGNNISENAYKRLKSSTKMEVNRFVAITEREVDKTLRLFDLNWGYPLGNESAILDMASGLRKSPYQTKNKKAVMGCALSHFMLWKMCLVLNETIVVLEHDALFNHEIDFDPSKHDFDIIGINDPKGATRKSTLYHDAISKNDSSVQFAPWIDTRDIPQGLAGNSAYIIKPSGARLLVNLVNEYGLWPNDAIMCRQLIPKLGVTKKYYTKLQGTRSTTTQ